LDGAKDFYCAVHAYRSKLAILLHVDTATPLYGQYQERLRSLAAGEASPSLPEFIKDCVRGCWGADRFYSLVVYDLVSSSREVVPNFSLRAMHAFAMAFVGLQLSASARRATSPSRLCGTALFKAYMLSLIRNCLVPVRVRRLVSMLKAGPPQGRAGKGRAQDALSTRGMAELLRNQKLFTAYPDCWTIIPYSIKDNHKEHFGGLVFYRPVRSVLSRARKDAIVAWVKGPQQNLHTIIMGPFGLDLLVVFAQAGTRQMWPGLLSDLHDALGEDFVCLLVSEMAGAFDRAIAFRTLLDASIVRDETPAVRPLDGDSVLSKLARECIESKTLSRAADNHITPGFQPDRDFIDRWVEAGKHFLMARTGEPFAAETYVSLVVKPEDRPGGLVFGFAGWSCA
jgi:hypothetical protein